MRSSRTWASDSSIPLVLGASSFEFWLFNWLREVVLLKSAVNFLSFSDQYHILTQFQYYNMSDRGLTNGIHKNFSIKIRGFKLPSKSYLEYVCDI